MKQGSEDQLADVVAVEPCLDHHGANDRNRRRGKGDSPDLGGVQVPIQHVVTEAESAEERKPEGHHSDADARLPVPSERYRVDLGPREERQHDRPDGLRKLGAAHDE
jgi:hypothetical protein